LFISAAFQANAQELVKIVDPGLTFSYFLPEGWDNSDDPYYHYIKPPCASKGLELTYYDGRCKIVEDCFEAETKGAFPKKYSDFKIEESGSLLVGESTSPWIIFTFSEDGSKKYGFYTTFIKLKQQFTFLFIEEKKCFKKSENNIRELIEDFRIQSN
jgi:hypothetical protein